MNAWTKKVLLLGVALGLATASCARDPKKPGYEFLPDMAHSVPYDAFAPNPNTPLGQTLLTPPAGTIPRGTMPFEYAKTPEEAERAGRELTNPIPYSTEALARGQVVYETFCLICHGATGKGDGPLIPKYPNPPSFTSKNVKQYPPGRLYHVITLGAGEMGAYGSQIAPEDRWKLVFYVQQLQGKTVEEIQVQVTEPETQPETIPETLPETQPAIETPPETQPTETSPAPETQPTEGVPHES